MSRISAPLPRKAWYRVLYIQVLIAVAPGIFVGHYRTVIGRGVVWSGILGADLVGPDVKHTLKPLGDGFIKLVKMMIAPIIFCTVVHGIASKGASGATGAGFVTLAATLAAVPSIPIASLALLVGIDRFMSECRALTNFIGNGVATMAISRWEKEVTSETLRKNLRNPPSLEPAAEPAQLR